MPKSEQSKQDANLDVLRSIAVLAVLASHLAFYYVVLSPFWFSWGEFGVRIFFVHTSLVLMMSLDRLAARHSGVALPFYIQRAFRIYPLSILCVLVVVTFHIRANSFSIRYDRPSTFMLISNLLLVQNITRVGSVSSPLWSLPYEMQMYAVLPFLYRLLKRHAEWWVMAALVVISLGLGSLQLLFYFGKAVQFFPCFMGGILAFWLRRRQKAFFPAGLWPMWVIGVGFLYYAKSFFGDSFVGCLILGASAGWFRDLTPGFGAALAHQVAKYSYGIYLAHTPLLLLCFRILPLGSQAARWVLFLLLLPLVVTALFHGIESPLIKMGRRLTAPRKEAPFDVPRLITEIRSEGCGGAKKA
jgi:peptidoglycan/LPS O-acetylase OafA/YrhL